MSAPRNTASAGVLPGGGVALGVGVLAAAAHLAVGGAWLGAAAWPLVFVGLHLAQLGGWARWGRLDDSGGARWAWTLLGLLPLPLLVQAAISGDRPHSLHGWAAMVLATALWRGLSLARQAARSGQDVPWAAARLAAAPLAVAALVALAHSPSGDAAHYLRITRSLAEDGDLELSNQLAAEYPGDDPATWPFHGVRQRVGDTWRLRSQHLPGLPALLLPGWVLAGRLGAAITLWLLAVLTCGLAAAWCLASGRSPPLALAGALGAVVAVPVGTYGGIAFPEIVAAALLLAGALAARHATPVAALLSAVALAALPWLNARYIPAGAVLGLWALWRAVRGDRRPFAAMPLVIVPALSAWAWFAFLHAQYGSWDPRAGFGQAGAWLRADAPAHAATALWGSLFDTRVGLLVVAPIWLVALWRGTGRIGAVWCWPVLGPLVVTLGVAAFGPASWHGSWAPPCRFLVSVLPLAAPWLAAGLAASWRARARPLIWVLAAVAVVQTVVMCSNPHLAWTDGPQGPRPGIWRVFGR